MLSRERAINEFFNIGGHGLLFRHWADFGFGLHVALSRGVLSPVIFFSVVCAALLLYSAFRFGAFMEKFRNNRHGLVCSKCMAKFIRDSEDDDEG
jgi:hypothetical protein